ncbi:MAG TPA: helix-turn-helix domain-containing protein [Nodosilinea sp.]|nr:helix-turn-helix domain-containing protein [Nodosilinea sp.]
MGKAGQVLKHVLEKYDVSQYSLAKSLGVERTNVYRWVHEMRDPTAETLLDIVKALKTLNHQAAEEFIELYLRDALKDNET